MITRRTVLKGFGAVALTPIRGCSDIVNYFTGNEEEIDKLLGIEVYSKKSLNGIMMYFLPLKRVQSSAVFTVNFGSKDVVLSDKGQSIILPAGTAHFLEHILFRSEDSRISKTLKKYYASSNAATGRTYTNYLLDFLPKYSKESLQALAKIVGTINVTKETVDLERGPILEELRRSKDSPSSVSYSEILSMLYHTPYGIDALGTEANIMKDIDLDVLKKTYDKVYNPANIFVIVSGNYKANELFETLDEILQKEINNEPERHEIYYDEPVKVKKKYSEISMKNLFKPLLAIGLKRIPTIDDADLTKETEAVSAIFNILFNSSTDFYNGLYREGLIDDSFYSDYAYGKGYGFVYLKGLTENSGKLSEKIFDHIQLYRKNGITKEELDLYLGYSIKSLVDAIETPFDFAYTFAFLKANNIDLIEYFRTLRKLDVDYINKVLRSLDVNNSSTLVIKPSQY